LLLTDSGLLPALGTVSTTSNHQLADRRAHEEVRMGLHRGISRLATVATTAAIFASGAPIASAHAISTGSGSGGPTVAASSQPPADSSTDWALIGVSAAGGAVLTAAGMTAARRRGHGTTSRSTASAS
jgi:hypothetical protein